MRLRLFLFSWLLIGCGTSAGLSAQKGVLKSANKYFENERYADALDLYNQVKKISKKKEAIYRRGIANYHCHNLDEAIADLTQAYTLGIDDKKVYYYVGKAMHRNGDYKDAVQFYKNYLRYTEDEEEKHQVIECIKRCATGLRLKYGEQIAFVENLGNTVNTIYNESNPVPSPSNNNKFYFSADRDDATGGMRNKKGLKDEIYGKYSKDMYAVEIVDGNWTSVNAFHPLLNSAKDDILLDFSSDGSVMYFMKSLNGTHGELLTDTFSVDRDEGAFPKKLHLPMIGELGDRDLQVYNDSIILFSSARKGGYGGYDIYAAQSKNGVWQTPVNLGPNINTPFDEVSPYLLRSGSKLYFSSDRLESMGGFDIFEISYGVESQNWSAVANLGTPINSPADDLDYSVSLDGTQGVFSSDREESLGGYDLYLAYLKEPESEQLSYTGIMPYLQTIANDSSDVAEENPVLDDNVPATPEVKKREYVNTPLYYGDDENILIPTNASKLKAIYDLMIIFPELEVLFTCHAMPEGLPGADLYFSIKRAEKAADYLTEKGIAAERIHLRGLGANFPLAEIISNGRVSRLATKNNRRIDVSFHNVTSDRLTIVEDEPIIADNFKNGKGDRYNDIVNDISYKVFFTNVKQMYKGDLLKKYDHTTIEKTGTQDSYDYTLGLFDLYNEARAFKNKLIRENVTNATIQVYLNGKQLTRSEIEALVPSYPDLDNYLLYD